MIYRTFMKVKIITVKYTTLLLLDTNHVMHENILRETLLFYNVKLLYCYEHLSTEINVTDKRLQTWQYDHALAI